MHLLIIKEADVSSYYMRRSHLLVLYNKNTGLPEMQKYIFLISKMTRTGPPWLETAPYSTRTKRIASRNVFKRVPDPKTPQKRRKNVK